MQVGVYQLGSQWVDASRTPRLCCRRSWRRRRLAKKVGTAAKQIGWGGSGSFFGGLAHYILPKVHRQGQDAAALFAYQQ